MKMFWSMFQQTGIIIMIPAFQIAISSFLDLKLKKLENLIFASISVILLVLLYFTDLLLIKVIDLEIIGGYQYKTAPLYVIVLLCLAASLSYNFIRFLRAPNVPKIDKTIFAAGIGIGCVTGLFDIINGHYNLNILFEGASFTIGMVFVCISFLYLIIKDYLYLYKELDQDKVKIEKLLYKSRKGFIDIIQLIVTSLEARDKYTAGHSIRVTEYSILLAKKVNISDDDLKILEAACKLHDIGKIGIPESVLNKPGKLSVEEFAMIKKHPEIAVDILSNVDYFVRILSCILYHHERIDGKGYPKGLKGNNIPFLSRIIAIADTFDAITSDRPYREAMSKAKAIEILISVKDTQLDSRLVETFLEII